MLQEINEHEIYLSRTLKRFKVLNKAKHAQDCSHPMIVFTNLDETNDSPIGTIWVISESLFLTMFSESEHQKGT